MKDAELFDDVADEVVEILGKQYAVDPMENCRRQAELAVDAVRTAVANLQALIPPVAIAVDADAFAGSSFFSYSPESFLALQRLFAQMPGGAVTPLHVDPLCDGSERAQAIVVIRDISQLLACNGWSDDKHLADILEHAVLTPLEYVVQGFKLMKYALEQIRDYEAPETSDRDHLECVAQTNLADLALTQLLKNSPLSLL